MRCTSWIFSNCVSGWTKTVRPPTDYTNALKLEQMREYGETGSPADYQEDHLISLELGGSNSIANLWPEAADANPGFHEKDRVENYLHKQVCDGAISLATAQYEIAHDWVAVYQSLPG